MTFLLGRWRVAAIYVFKMKFVFSKMLSNHNALVVFSLKQAGLATQA